MLLTGFDKFFKQLKLMTNMNFKGIFLTGILILIIFSLTPSFALAHPHSGLVMINGHTHAPQTETIPFNSIMGLEKTTLFFHASASNKLPWGFIEGNVVNHVEGYPVVIQIFKNGEAVHFAQTNVEEDGDYEYRFRVVNSDHDKTIKIFEGDYSVTIFKVVYLGQVNPI